MAIAHPDKLKSIWPALKVAMVYFLIGCLWILISDKVVAQFTTNLQLLTEIQTYKGWVFISVTAILVFILVRRQILIEIHIQDELKKSRDTLEYRVQERTRELELLAVTDSLTGAFNRRYMIEKINQEIIRSQRYAHSFSTIMLDIDHFKDINDLSGHDCGDEAIRSVARKCQSVIRDTDMLCRFGGDEFVVILPETNTIQVKHIADKLIHTLSEIRITSPKAIHNITVSIGVSELKKSDSSYEQILKRTDEALYLAKHNGRNRFEIQ